MGSIFVTHFFFESNFPSFKKKLIAVIPPQKKKNNCGINFTNVTRLQKEFDAHLQFQILSFISDYLVAFTKDVFILLPLLTQKTTLRAAINLRELDTGMFLQFEFSVMTE